MELHNTKCRKRLFDKDNIEIRPKKKMKIDLAKNKDYGPKAEQPEDEEVIIKEVEEILNRLQVTEAERDLLQEKSVGQFGNEVFEAERKDRLTASMFGRIIKRKAYTPCHNMVRACLKTNNFWSKATEYGIAKEKVAIVIFENRTQLHVRDSGLWVDLEYGCLGASPDGLDSEDAIVEVKCIFSASKLQFQSNSILEVVQKLKGKIC